MKPVHTLFLIVAVLIQPLLSMGGANHPAPVDSATKAKIEQWLENHGGLNFLENKGQMADMNGNSLKSLLFKASAGGVDMYVTTKGLSYVFTDKKILKHKNPDPIGDYEDSVTGQYCRADMELVGADIRKENIVKEGESETYTNYYLGNCPNGVFKVHSYQRITIKNIYPGIDWTLYTAKGKKGLQYDFIVHPGANPSSIKLRYKWAGKPQMQNDGSLKINIPLGYITEGKPVTYQPLATSHTIHTAYTLHNNEISFALAGYNKNKTLVIDPALNWSTYYGGSASDAANWIYENGGDVWITGNATSTDFPLTNLAGAYNQGTLTGATQNIFILCFNAATGVPVWATYYGGTSAGETDQGFCVSGDANNIWIVGQVGMATGSVTSPTFPTANPNHYNWYEAYDSICNNTGLTAAAAGGYTPMPPDTTVGKHPVNACPFILEFNKSSGLRLYATYFGGFQGQGDYGKSIWDDGVHVFVGVSPSSDNFPCLYSAGYYHQTYLGSVAPGIIEFTVGGSLVWSTYYGSGSIGSGNTQSVCSDGANVWITGTSYSGDIPVVNPGGSAFYQGTSPSNACSFIAKFTPAGVNEWVTFYGGNAATTQTYGGSWTRTGYGQSIYSDGTNVWVTGTTGSSNLPLLNPGGGAYYQSSIGTGFHAYITEFNCSTEAMEWGTYYAGSGTSSTNGAEAERGSSIIEDTAGNVWVTGETQSTDFPTQYVNCSYNQDALGGTQNGFVLQFDTNGVRKWATYFGGNGTDEGNSICSDGVNVWLTGETTSSNFPVMNLGGAYNQATNAGTENAFVSKFIPSIPLTVTLSPPPSSCAGVNDTLKASGGIAYSWSTGETTTQIIVTPTTTTTYTVGVSNATCTVDTSILVTVTPLPSALITGADSVCSGDSTTLTASGGGTYVWNTGATSTSIIVKPTSNTTYSVTVTADGCSKDTSITVTVNTLTPGITAPLSICYGDTTTLTVSGGNKYEWNTGSTTSSIKVYPASSTTYSVTIINGACMKDTSVAVSLNPLPVAGVSPAKQICKGDSVALSASGGTGYLWNNGQTSNNITVAPATTTIYTVAVINSFGCKKDTTVQVTVVSSNGSVSGPGYLCPGDSITLKASGGGTYKWSTGATVNSIVVSPSANTSYYVIVSNVCIDTVTKVVSIDNPPLYACCDTIVYTPGTSVILRASGDSAYYWSPDTGISCTSCPNPVVSPTVTTTYTVIGIDSAGCRVERTITVDIENCAQVTVPNIFTPNGDGINDDFVVNAQNTTAYSIDIYNRWGKEVYKSTNPDAYWNGMDQNDNSYVAAGVYYYLIKYTCDNKSYNKDGYVQLIR